MVANSKKLITLVIVVVLAGHVVCLGQAELDGWITASHSGTIYVGEVLEITLGLRNVGTVDIAGGVSMYVSITPTGYFTDEVGRLGSDHYYGTIYRGDTIELYCSDTISLGSRPLLVRRLAFIQRQHLVSIHRT